MTTATPSVPALEETRTPTPNLIPEETRTPNNPSSPIHTEKVNFLTEDGISLTGTLFGEGDVVVILAHQGTSGSDQTSWQPFAQLIAEDGFSALTFDFRGFGESEGEVQYGKVAVDVGAAINFLHDRGFDQIICVGASMGGTACIQAALDGRVIGLATLGSTLKAGFGNHSLQIDPESFAALSLPKIFISAEDDFSTVVNHTRRMYEHSPEPKELILLPGSAHGTHLFQTEAGPELRRVLLTFLETFR